MSTTFFSYWSLHKPKVANLSLLAADELLALFSSFGIIFVQVFASILAVLQGRPSDRCQLLPRIPVGYTFALSFLFWEYFRKAWKVNHLRNLGFLSNIQGRGNYSHNFIPDHKEW